MSVAFVERTSNIMVLTEKENNVIKNLRSPFISVTSHNYINELTSKELLSLYNKMDDYIEKESDLRRSLGSYDEFFALELLGVKERLKQLYEKQPNKNDLHELSLFLKKYSKNKTFNDIICESNNATMKEMLNKYKEQYFEKILKEEKLKYNDISIDNPLVGDIEICVIRLQEQLNEDLRKRKR